MGGTFGARDPDGVVDATLALLGRASAGLALPRVTGLHLPPCPFTGDKDGEFGALALADGSVGLAYLLLDDALGMLADERPALADADPLETTRLWRAVNPAHRAIGHAAVNALTAHLYRRAGYTPPSATDSIAGLAPAAGEHVGMVGFFPPLPRAVAAGGAQLTVLELDDSVVAPDADDGERGWTVTTDPDALGDCDKVLLTSTALMNGTLDALLACCRADATIAIVGPGAGCLPDALFARGIDRLCGLVVENPEALLPALETGAPWGRFTRKTCIARGSDQPWSDPAARSHGSDPAVRRKTDAERTPGRIRSRRSRGPDLP